MVEGNPLHPFFLMLDSHLSSFSTCKQELASQPGKSTGAICIGAFFILQKGDCGTVSQYLESNEPINETKSNVAIMASSLAWGVGPGAAIEGGLQFAHHRAKKADPNSEKTKQLHNALYETADQIDFRGYMGENVASENLNKLAKTKVGSYLFNGPSTAKGRFMNYGVGGALSVLSGALAIKNKDKE